MSLINLSVQPLQLSFVSEPREVPAGHTEDLDRSLQSPNRLQTDAIPWPALHINIDTVSEVLVLKRKRSIMFVTVWMAIVALKHFSF